MTDLEDAWACSRFDERDNPAKWSRLTEDRFNPKGFTPTQVFLLSGHPSLIGSKDFDTQFDQRDDQHALLDEFRQAHPEVCVLGDQY